MRISHDIKGGYIIVPEENTFVVKANVLVPNTYYFELSINGWTVIPTSGGTIYVKEFLLNSARKDWQESVTDLRYILLSCFLDDLSPRFIDRFDIIGNIDQDTRVNLFFTFGQYDRNESPETKFKKAFYISGDLFNGLFRLISNYQPNVEQIKYWFLLFKKQNGLAINLNFILQSFIILNRYFHSISYYDPTDLYNAVIFLVSGLEGLFLQGQNDVADLSFKFKIVGSIYYDKYCDVSLLKKTSDETDKENKYTIKEFRDILHELYKLRSYIAHGSYDKLNKCKIWKPI